MRVHGIKIEDQAYCIERQCHAARVIVLIDDVIMTLFCRSHLPADAPEASCRAALLGEALRQIGRMPEFRSGSERLSLAAGLRAEASPELA